MVIRHPAKAGGVAEKEMLRTFNCGVGMVVVVSAEEADTVAAVLEQEGETVFRIGAIQAAGPQPVLFDNALGLGK